MQLTIRNKLSRLSVLQQLGRARNAVSAALLGYVVAGHQMALAALPTVQAPDGVADGDYIGLWGALLKLGVNVIVLGIGAFAFYKIAAGGMTKWAQYQKGQIELSDMKEYFIGGTIVLVTIVALLTVANQMFDA